VIINGSYQEGNKEGSQESTEEDRKEEIGSPLYAGTHFLGWRRHSPAFFLRSSPI
jgi:hypothetical protein